jgi:hypothetical protein
VVVAVVHLLLVMAVVHLHHNRVVVVAVAESLTFLHPSSVL